MMYEVDSHKPEYRVPSMGEIAALPDNGYRVLSTFSGCGGSSLGYKMAGFKVLWASEFIPAAQDSYRANHPDTILDTRDIRQVKVQEILDNIQMQPGQLDIFDGSPPCASFSTSGKREAGWGKTKTYSDTKQRTDDLFFEYVRLIQGVQPKVFVAENVSGLVKGVAKGYFLEILAALKGAGYNVKAKVLDAQWLGVPQMRQRVIFIGVRNDLNVDPVHPKPLSYNYSVRDAIPWIVKIETPKGLLDAGKNHSPCIVTSPREGSYTHLLVEAEADISPIEGSHPRFLVEPETDISRFAIGREWDNIKPGENSEKYLSLKKPSLGRPSYTVTAGTGNEGVASVVHPTEKRRFSIGELKRISAFPDDFILTGTYDQQWERIGRAVPPVMMYHIAKTIRDEILCKITS